MVETCYFQKRSFGREAIAVVYVRSERSHGQIIPLAASCERPVNLTIPTRAHEIKGATNACGSSLLRQVTTISLILRVEPQAFPPLTTSTDYPRISPSNLPEI